MFGRPLWITEFGSDDPTPLDGSTISGAYHARMFRALDQRADVAANVAFCWSEGMVGGFGLFDTSNPAAGMAAFKSIEALDQELAGIVFGRGRG